MTSRAYGARSPRSHYDVTLIVTSFATELATPTVTDVYVRTDTLPRLKYTDLTSWRICPGAGSISRQEVKEYPITAPPHVTPSSSHNHSGPNIFPGLRLCY